MSTDWTRKSPPHVDFPWFSMLVYWRLLEATEWRHYMCDVLVGLHPLTPAEGSSYHHNLREVRRSESPCLKHLQVQRMLVNKIFRGNWWNPFRCRSKKISKNLSRLPQKSIFCSELSAFTLSYSIKSRICWDVSSRNFQWGHPDSPTRYGAHKKKQREEPKGPKGTKPNSTQQQSSASQYITSQSPENCLQPSVSLAPVNPRGSSSAGRFRCRRAKW